MAGGLGCLGLVCRTVLGSFMVYFGCFWGGELWGLRVVISCALRLGFID